MHREVEYTHNCHLFIGWQFYYHLESLAFSYTLARDIFVLAHLF